MEKANELVELIDLKGDEEMKTMFDEGNKGLEKILLEKCHVPRMLSKALVFPEDVD